MTFNNGPLLNESLKTVTTQNQPKYRQYNISVLHTLLFYMLWKLGLSSKFYFCPFSDMVPLAALHYFPL